MYLILILIHFSWTSKTIFFFTKKALTILSFLSWWSTRVSLQCVHSENSNNKLVYILTCYGVVLFDRACMVLRKIHFKILYFKTRVFAFVSHQGLVAINISVRLTAKSNFVSSQQDKSYFAVSHTYLFSATGPRVKKLTPPRKIFMAWRKCFHCRGNVSTV